jgi:hypothetical protein
MVIATSRASAADHGEWSARGARGTKVDAEVARRYGQHPSDISSREEKRGRHRSPQELGQCQVVAAPVSASTLELPCAAGNNGNGQCHRQRDSQPFHDLDSPADGQEKCEVADRHTADDRRGEVEDDQR